MSQHQSLEGDTLMDSWNFLRFRIESDGDQYEYDATAQIQPYVMQFLTTNPIAKASFDAKISKHGVHLNVISDGFIRVKADGYNIHDKNFPTMLFTICKELSGKVAKKRTFESDHDFQYTMKLLESAVQSLLNSGLVCIYRLRQEKGLSVIIQGSLDEVTLITDEIDRILQSVVKLDEDTVQCLHQLDFEKYFQEKCPNVSFTVHEKDLSKIFFKAKSDHDLKKAKFELESFVQKIRKEDVHFSEPIIEFTLSKNVYACIVGRLQLLHIPAYVQVGSDTVAIWCQGDITMNKAKKELMDYLKVERVSNSIIKLKAETLKAVVEESHEKIQTFPCNDNSKDFFICYTKDKEQVVRKLLNMIDSEIKSLEIRVGADNQRTVEFQSKKTEHSKECHEAVSKYLQTFGSKMIDIVANRYQVGIRIEGRNIIVKGSDEVAKKVMQDLKKMIPTSIIHLEKTAALDVISSEEGRKQLDAIAEENGCCWRIKDIFPQACNKSEQSPIKGIEYVTTWILHEGKTHINVACAEFKEAELDVLILPVDSSFMGIDPATGVKRNYGGYSSQFRNRQLGEYVWCSPNKLFGCKSIVLVITSVVQIETATQVTKEADEKMLGKVFKEVFEQAQKWKYSSIGCIYTVADAHVSTFNNLEVKSFLNLAKGQKGQSNENLSYFICFSNGFPEGLLKNVDSFLQGEAGTRRITSAEARALFEPPNVTTTVQSVSLTESKCECIVSGISRYLDLKKGAVTTVIGDEAGEKLQEDLDLKKTEKMEFGKVIHTSPKKLSEKGVKALLFGVLPVWKDCDVGHKIPRFLATFIQKCLLMADECGCSSVAFPALGTGKLHYPEREVVNSTLDGIQKYVAEGMIGNITDVTIAIPGSEENEMYKMFENEKQRRLVEPNADSVFKDNSYDVIKASNGKVNYVIVEEKHLKDRLPVTYMKVEFTVGSGKEGTRFSQTELKVDCENDKTGIAKATGHVIDFCETNRITSITISTSHNLKNVSVADQVEEIVKSIVSAGDLLYLHNAVIVVTDEADFKSIEGRFEKDQEGFMKTLYRKVPWITHLEWKKEQNSRQKVEDSLYVQVIGGSENDVAKCKKEIQDWISSPEVAALGSCKAEQSIDSDENKQDEVSADLNPGIVKFLTDSKRYSAWKDSVNKAFGVEIVERDDSIVVQGPFESILHLEDYLEYRFPELPEAEAEMDAGENDKTVSVTDKTEKCGVAFTFNKLTVYIYVCDSITSVKTDAICSSSDSALSCNMGVSWHIASKAGKEMKDACKALVKNKVLQVNECVTTTAGKLPYNCIFHVYSPMKGAGIIPDIKVAFLNVLGKAEEERVHSVAIPLIGAGNSKFPLDQCALQYFHALEEHSAQQQYLQEVHLVDIVPKNIEQVRNVFHADISMANSLPPVSKEQTSSLTSTFNFGNSQLIVSTADILQVDSQVKVLKGRSLFQSEDDDDIQKVQKAANSRFREWYAKYKSKKLDVGSATILTDDVGLRCALLVCVPPKTTGDLKNKEQKETFERDCKLTVNNMMMKVSELKKKSICVPILYDAGLQTQSEICCKTMVKSFLAWFQRGTTVAEVHILCRTKSIFNTFCTIVRSNAGVGNLKSS